MTLPPIRIGQVWQCRDQQYTAVITAIDGAGRISYTYLTVNPRDPNGIHAGDNMSRTTSIRDDSYAVRVREHDFYDFINLLYEP